MHYGYAFSILAVVIAFTVMLVVFKTPEAMVKWWKNPSSSNARKGIQMFVGIAILAGIIVANTADASEVDHEIEWFKYGELYVGIDHPMMGRPSPQCIEGGPNDKWTSNGGLRVNIATYRLLEVNFKYTHHSCAFNNDINLYDAVGGEITLRLW